MDLLKGVCGCGCVGVIQTTSRDPFQPKLLCDFAILFHVLLQTWHLTPFPHLLRSPPYEESELELHFLNIINPAGCSNREIRLYVRVGETQPLLLVFLIPHCKNKSMLEVALSCLSHWYSCEIFGSWLSLILVLWMFLGHPALQVEGCLGLIREWQHFCIWLAAVRLFFFGLEAELTNWKKKNAHQRAYNIMCKTENKMLLGMNETF